LRTRAVNGKALGNCGIWHKGETNMFSHMMVGSNDIARSKKFYDATFVAMGGKPGMQILKGA
jgi:hypothetical protein